MELSSCVKNNGIVGISAAATKSPTSMTHSWGTIGFHNSRRRESPAGHTIPSWTVGGSNWKILFWCLFARQHCLICHRHGGQIRMRSVLSGESSGGGPPLLSNTAECSTLYPWLTPLGCHCPLGSVCPLGLFDHPPLPQLHAFVDLTPFLQFLTRFFSFVLLLL